jgi:hypothetical protein
MITICERRARKEERSNRQSFIRRHAVSPIRFPRSPTRRYADPPTRFSQSVPESEAYLLCQELLTDPFGFRKTDLKAEQASKEVVHDRYRDLALVEQAFRTSKTVEL